jgi:hypothetical protein
LKIAEDFKEKISEDDPIVLHWITLLEDFQQNIELLKKLLSDAMTVWFNYLLLLLFNNYLFFLRLINGNFYFVQMVMIMIHNIIIGFKI